ncbi:MAG: FAD-binding protein, partial [Nitrospinota bacterium]
MVGSGAAGLRAALEARRAGVRVLLVSKGRTGLGNVTAVAGGGIVAPFGHADPRDNPDVYFEDTLASGRGLCDPELVRIFVNEACREILHLQQLGLAFRMEPDGRFVQLYQPGHSFPRDCKVAGPSRTESWVPTFEGGRLLSMSLKKAAAQIGVECLERTIVFDLCSDNLGIAGAIGVDETMNLIVIE